MRLEAVELWRVRLPFRTPFRSALGETSVRDLVLVRVVTDVAEGWGECAALADPHYTAEYADGAATVLRSYLVPRLAAAGTVSAAGVGAALAAVRGHRMAKAALEMAVLDAELRAAGQPLAARLGATGATVEAGVAVGIARSTAELVDRVAAALAEGYRRVRLKVAPGWDAEPVRAVRERFGDSVALQADANGAYRLDDAAALAALDPFGLDALEQPLAADDLVGHARLARLIRTPIALDESVTSARWAAGAGAWCGGMFESGLARAANLALAALPGFTLPGDVSPPSRYLAADVVAPLVARGGRLAVPDRPGIGADVDPDRLRQVTVSVEPVALR